MSYVDAYHDRDTDTIHIVKRVNGKREYEDFPTVYKFYYDDPRGKYRTIYGNPVSLFSTNSGKEFYKETKRRDPKIIWESDLNPINRCLSENFRDVDPPKLHIMFVDIESDFHLERGFSSPEDPFNAVVAITCYLSWTDQLITLAVPPKTITMTVAQQMVSRFENVFLFEKETDMILSFLDLLDDADIISGWNSEGYDLPYLVNRTTTILSKDDTRRFCLWGNYPRLRTFERFGSEHITYDLIGRIHLDYMQLYRKYTYEERHSYSLNAIAEYELNEKKVEYEGTLDELYNKDFEKFIDYNRQDVLLLKKLNLKLRFIGLSNQLAHENTILLPATMGTVALTEQAIINRAHDNNQIVPNRKHKLEGESQAAGAYVAYPKKGMHQWIGSTDINSLYPNTIRALNMGPDTIVGQIRLDLTKHIINKRLEKGSSFADAWEGEFGSQEYQAVMRKDPGVQITIDWEHTDRSDTMSAADCWSLIFGHNQPWTLSANGTIFTYEKIGIIPGLLADWYSDRKSLQKKKAEAKTKEEADYYDQRQHSKKIQLNALYGALLNSGCRFEDVRIGQSITLSGRVIVKHMSSFVNETFTGEYNHVGDSVIYGDTDSVYFSVWPIIQNKIKSKEIDWSKETCIELYDNVAEMINESFPDFCHRAFHTPEENGKLIKCGRELVGSRGLYITKKRYAVLMIDKDGKRLDIDGKPGKLKAMGLDLRRSDTPKIVQEFLTDILMDLLQGHEQNIIIDKIKEFKLNFKQLNPWEKGSPKRVNNLTAYSAKDEKAGKANLPGHVRASLNWNKLREMHRDRYSTQIVDGMKVIVCKLRPNPLGYTSVAYPVDQHHLPSWFTSLPFDHSAMEETIVDKKIGNLLDVLGWNIKEKTQTANNFTDLFTFE